MEKSKIIHLRATESDKAKLEGLKVMLPGITQSDLIRASLHRLFKKTENMNQAELYKLVSDAIVEL